MIKRLIYTSGVLLFLLLHACDQKEQYTHADKMSWSDFGEEIRLSGEILPLENELLKPIRILASDSILYLGNMHTSHLLQLIALHKDNGKTLGECISFGSGPQEMTYVNKIEKKGDFLYLYDINQLRLSEFVLGDSLPSFQKSTQFDAPFEDLSVISDSSVMALVLNPEMKRLSYYQNGELLRTFGDYPQIAGRTISPLEQLEGFSSSITMDDACKRVAVVYKNTDLIEVYSVDGTLLKRVHGPDHFFPEVSTVQGDEFQKVTSESGKSREGYFFPVSSGNHFFVLYSGRTTNLKQPDYLMEWIFVFDWNGNPVKRYKLDHPVFFFAIDGETKTMYGISDSPEFNIVRYRL